MTKVSVFGQETEKKKRTPINFEKVLSNKGILVDNIFKPLILRI